MFDWIESVRDFFVYTAAGKVIAVVAAIAVVAGALLATGVVGAGTAPPPAAAPTVTEPGTGSVTVETTPEGGQVLTNREILSTSPGRLPRTCLEAVDALTAFAASASNVAELSDHDSLDFYAVAEIAKDVCSYRDYVHYERGLEHFLRADTGPAGTDPALPADQPAG